jgi:hypothetical protein
LRLTGVPSQRNSVAADPVRSKIVRLPLQPGTHYLDGSISQLAVHRSEFHSILQREGVDGLVMALDRNVDLLRNVAKAS